MNRDFPKGQLWELVTLRSLEAQAAGCLLRLETDEELIVEEGTGFVLRVSRNLERRQNEGNRESTPNPFLPYDPALYVADAGAKHVVLLNKYNVLENHLLVITREFEPQDSLLTLADFEALCLCLAERESLGFYNSGPTAGASQPHKHLQIVPLPLSAQTAALPMAPRLDRQPPAFPHFHRHLPKLEHPREWARTMQAAYQEGLVRLGIGVPAALHPLSRPYNLLVTWDRILMVPRCRDRFGEVSINALGFAGSFFVKSRADAEILRQAGPLRVLREVAG